MRVGTKSHFKLVFALVVVVMSVIFVASILYFAIGTKGNLISTHSPYTGESSYGHGWNSTIKLYLENIGGGPATITDFVINGNSYSSYVPMPTVNPSIENGYTVSPFQSVTFTIKLINQPAALYQGGNELYVLTKDGQSLRIYLGS
jgi:hypothetical protein